MSNNVHRANAEAARTAAAATDLPRVRERHLRSAEASDAIAAMEERAAAGSKIRADAAAVRKAELAAEDDDEHEDAG